MDPQASGKLVDASCNTLELIADPSSADMDAGAASGLFFSPYVTKLQNHETHGMFFCLFAVSVARGPFLTSPLGANFDPQG
jgi:hypothetical protein